MNRMTWPKAGRYRKLFVTTLFKVFDNFVILPLIVAVVISGVVVAFSFLSVFGVNIKKFFSTYFNQSKYIVKFGSI